jgi:hypothetical protein
MVAKLCQGYPYQEVKSPYGMTDQKIQFVRIYKITWPYRFDSEKSVEFNKFLFNHGIRSAASYQKDIDDERYEPKDVKTDTSVYTVVMHGKDCLEFDSVLKCDRAITQLQEAFPDASITKKVDTTSSIEYGVERRLKPFLMVHGLRNTLARYQPYNILGHVDNDLDPDLDIEAMVEFTSSWGKTTLEFRFTWSPTVKPSVAAVESVLVDETLDFTAGVESKIERGLSEICDWDDEAILDRDVYCATESRVDTNVECKPAVMTGIQARKAELEEEE